MPTTRRSRPFCCGSRKRRRDACGFFKTAIAISLQVQARGCSHEGQDRLAAAAAAVPGQGWKALLPFLHSLQASSLTLDFAARCQPAAATRWGWRRARDRTAAVPVALKVASIQIALLI